MGSNCQYSLHSKQMFEVTTGVRQGCLLSPFLFLLVIDWIMKTATKGRKNAIFNGILGYKWTTLILLTIKLCYLTTRDRCRIKQHSWQKKKIKSNQKTDLKNVKKKTKILRTNTTCNTAILLEEEFKYCTWAA